MKPNKLSDGPRLQHLAEHPLLYNHFAVGSVATYAAYIISAAVSNAQAIVCLNKSNLCRPGIFSVYPGIKAPL